MPEGEMPSVLRCGHCNKPFDKESTLKRHGYYCRTRKGGVSTRARSCISCAKGKARCDTRRPKCSRCITKATECQYPANTPKNTRTQHNSNASREQGQTAPSLDTDSPYFENLQTLQEESLDGGVVPDGTLFVCDSEFENIGPEGLDWIDPDTDLAEFLNSQMNCEAVPSSTLKLSSSARTAIQLTDQMAQVQRAISSSNVSIPTFPVSCSRSLSLRPRMKIGTQRISTLIFHTLKSYPRMMLNHNSLPPFIHPHLISSTVENNHMEPLTNCISLVHMISSRVQESRKLFWKNVRQECEHLSAERTNLNKLELLAAMQALSIYILIRLSEGETDHNNFDFLLLATVTMISQQLSRVSITYHTQSTLDSHSVEHGWKDWIFEESRRRLCVVYRVVNMLIYFEPVAMCELQKDLILVPLPAKKQLWEARDEFVWKTEIERDSGVQTDFGLAANGELVKMDEGQLYFGESMLLYQPLDHLKSSDRTEYWEEWCSGMDGLGGLVMLASSLIV